MGAPPTNLLDAHLTTEDGVLTVRAGGVRVPLWPGAEPGRDVVLGVRPEHLRPVAADHPGPELAGRVESVENLGSEEVARLRVGDAHVALRGPRPLGLRPGTGAVLTADPARCHLYDRSSGRRLVWSPDPTSPAPTPALAHS